MENATRLSLPGSGLRLAADAAGEPNAPTLLFLHGSGQTRQSWGRALEEAARRGYRALSLDLRGHGDSDWAPDGNYALESFAADVRQAIEHMGTEPILVGASLGGIVGMLIAAAPSPPPPLRALVLVDITPRVEMNGAKEVTAFMDSAPNGFASLEEAADAVAAYLPHRPRPKDTRGLQRNLRLRDGRYYWHWDPALLQMGRNANFNGPNPLEKAARALKLPTLLIRGSRSRIVSEAGAREFLEMVPHAEFVDISDAHHMVAGDANDAFNEAVFRFVDKINAAREPRSS
jgi:pimeloyl-ACP methyl ester carboxylesterase